MGYGDFNITWQELKEFSVSHIIRLYELFVEQKKKEEKKVEELKSKH